MPFSACKIKVRADAQKIDQYRDHVPQDHRSRSDQQSVVDPDNLKDTHDSCHPRMHPCTGSAPEHDHQVRQSSKGRPDSGQKAKDLGPLKPGEDQALRVVYRQVSTSIQRNHTQRNNNRHSHETIHIHSGNSCSIGLVLAGLFASVRRRIPSSDRRHSYQPCLERIPGS